jgi:ribosomal-protein-alanine N-acetyltransferase
MSSELAIRIAVLLVLLAVIVWYYRRPEGPGSPRLSPDPVAPIQLYTARLQLRDLRLEDQEAICAYLADPEVQQYLLPGQWHPSVIQANVAATVRSAQHLPRLRYGFALTLHERDEVVGTIAVDLERRLDQASIGWDMNKQYWRQGLMTEAARAVVAFIFVDTPVLQITADCDAANIASIRVMEHLGMRRQAINEVQQGDLQRRYGVRRPVARHVLTKAEWREVEEANVLRRAHD